MNEETVKTLSLCSFFVFLCGVLGFVISIILNAASLYIEAHSTNAYVLLIQTKLFASTSITFYLLTAVLFAGIGILIIYWWKKTSSA
ncbi:MAG: hypothetical protein NWF06_00640 [Candidatus Bathyarchaeota archaeon]|nr:hypothetical protein [Candidatus Bathyarchaeum sp.]